MRKLLYIVNPVSGTRNKQALRQLIEAKTKAAQLLFDIFPSAANGDYAHLDSLIHTEGFTDIVIAGGDGTVNQAINGLKKHGLPFGIIPCGSGNGLAFSAGIPKNPQKAIDIVFNGKKQWADAFLINDRFACMLCGLGFDAQVAHDFAQDRRRGLTTYIRKIVQNFFSAQVYPFVLQFAEKKLEIDAYFISIANSNQFGNHFTIAPKASLTDGLLDIVIMARQHKLNMLLQTLLQVSGFNRLQQMERVNEMAGVVYFQTTHITITNSLLAPLHIDGEAVPSFETIDIRVLPQSFQLIFP